MSAHRVKLILAVIAATVGLSVVQSGFSQTASTGGLTGTTTDATRALVPGVELKITNEATGEVRMAISNENGVYVFPLLAPGAYRLEAALSGFKTALRPGVRITVTETARLDIQLELGNLTETVTVEAAAAMVQQETSALGGVVNEVVVSSLPLATRNFTQILALSTGVTADVNNAAAIGRGNGGTGLARVVVNGSRGFDNAFQMDGAETTDFSQTATPGTAIPNPDTIAEFKVQTGQADASYGRNSGANVNIVTKSGTNQFHGSLFEFFRNEKLNANDFFFNRSGQKKPVTRQNQFGGTIGGPIKKEKLLFFGSYQRTQQAFGIGGSCSTTVSGPPLTNDRSAAALGALFAGQTGQNGGVAIRPDGSNINPIALRILNAKQPNGEYLFPTPQVIDPSQPFARRGFSAYSEACTFIENQYLANVDYLHRDNSKFAVRYFNARSSQIQPFAGTNVGPITPGRTISGFDVYSLTHTYVISPRIFNESRAFVFRPRQRADRDMPFKLSDFGISAPFYTVDERPTIAVTGSYTISRSSSNATPQFSWGFGDNISFVSGSHNLRVGGGAQRTHINYESKGGSGTPFLGGNITFLSFPDFLLGLDAASNGSQFSNISTSAATPGIRIKRMRTWDRNAYVQDDWKVRPRLTLNIGLRYEGHGKPEDIIGTNVNFDPFRANPNPPDSGTFAGYLLPANFQEKNNIPVNATIWHNSVGLNNEVDHTFGPRFGLAWQVLPNTNRLVLRGGYGMYYSHLSNPRQINMGALQFGGTVSRSGIDNAVATFANPFPPIPDRFTYSPENVVWGQLPFTPTSNISVNGSQLNFRVPVTHKYSLNIQSEVAHDFLLEIGYVGARGLHAHHVLPWNQALLASPSNPIRGITTNTVANVRQRVPLLGIPALGIEYTESSGKTWFNSLQTTLTKRMAKGLQFTGGYTFGRTMDLLAAGSNTATSGDHGPGDGRVNKTGYGRAETSRDHRFVFSYVYELPNVANQRGFIGRLASRWSVSGVTVLQSGRPLTILYTNSNNIYGRTDDRPSLAAGCTHADLVTPGRTQDKLNKFFNAACFTTPRVIGDDGRATDFGNLGSSVVDGPGQVNTDMSIRKEIPLGSDENKRLEFRAEFFNLFNTPQFNNPVTNFSASNFGQISSTSVNPRFIQLSLRLGF